MKRQGFASTAEAHDLGLPQTPAHTPLHPAPAPCGTCEDKGWAEGGRSVPSPPGSLAPARLPWGPEARDLERACWAAFSSLRREAFCSAACQRARGGCRLGHKGGLGRNLQAHRVIHQTLPRLPASAPSHSIPLPAAGGPPPPPAPEPCHVRQRRESQALGGRRGHTADTGKSPTGGSGSEESCFCCPV